MIFSFIKEKVLGLEGPIPLGEVKDNKDHIIALGVLLWLVAQADQRFLPEEKEGILRVLEQQGHVAKSDLPIVLKSIEVAAQERIDLYSFTQEVSGGLDRASKIKILEDLFRLACTDQDLAHEEHEVLRKIANLFRLDHAEFIAAKVKVKKEFGMDTAGL